VLILFTTFTILMYLLFSTIFHNYSLVGIIGQNIGIWNIKIFGYIAYINFLFILIPVYNFYKNPKLKESLDHYLGWTLLLVSILLLQVLILGINNSGIISTLIYQSLLPYIGTAGLWFLFFLTSILSFTLITQKDLTDIAYMLNLNSLKEEINQFKEQISNKINSFFAAKDVPIFNDKKIDQQVQPKPQKRKTQPTRQTNTQRKVKIDTPTPPIPEKTKRDTKESSNISSEKSKLKLTQVVEDNKKYLEQQIEQGKKESSNSSFKRPSTKLLQPIPKSKQTVNEAEILKKSRKLESKLKQFKITGEIGNILTGPLVTTFEYRPDAHIKVSKILNLQDDIAMALSAETIRIQAPIPGKGVVGIEIPNSKLETIYLREILESDIFKKAKSPLTLALGKDIVGNPFVTDLKKLPHLLVAGTTGSGKSVGINAMILSLLFNNTPQDLRLMLIDPKMLEFSIYNDIPHLLTPVITEPKKAIAALANLVKEMERRYKLMAQEKVKNIDNYNLKAKKTSLPHMPYIVVVIDELADLMMTGGKEVEYSIARLAQMARAAGIHIIVATQRPSVDVVTGLIKANLPARLSYRVGQKIDSKVILDTMGAESLLGRGDGLFTPPGANGVVRLHAPWSTEEEIEEIVEFLKAQQEPIYEESYLVTADAESSKTTDSDVELDPLFEEAKKVVLEDRKCSISYLQRKLQVGYNRSANIVEQLENKGILSAPNNKGVREILI